MEHFLTECWEAKIKVIIEANQKKGNITRSQLEHKVKKKVLEAREKASD